jgi:hypothetical protein
MNNRQAVSDYIRQNYGQTVLHALTQAQLENVLHLRSSIDCQISLLDSPVAAASLVTNWFRVLCSAGSKTVRR